MRVGSYRVSQCPCPLNPRPCIARGENEVIGIDSNFPTVTVPATPPPGVRPLIWRWTLAGWSAVWVTWSLRGKVSSWDATVRMVGEGMAMSVFGAVMSALPPAGPTADSGFVRRRPYRDD